MTFDELESTISADGSGVLSMPTDTRTKRQKGDDYPLAAASGIKKGWTEQADAFADYLKGMTAEKSCQAGDGGRREAQGCRPAFQLHHCH